MALPIFQDGNKNLMLMQTNWASQINPVLNSQLTQGVFVSDYTFKNGDNVINHKLGRAPQGWFFTDQSGAATVYRSQPFNKSTLTLNSSAAFSGSIYVF